MIRPIVLIGNRTAAQRAEETQLHPETVRALIRRFRHQGMLGLFPEQTEIVTPSRGKSVPEAVVEELARLKALYDGFGYRELARILWHKTQYRIDDQTVKKLWQQSAAPVQGALPFAPYHRHPNRYHARLQGMKRFYQGWTKRSISRFLHVSRPTGDQWIGRCEAEHFAGLVAQKPGPKSPRKIWFPIMVQVYHLQKAHPDAGEFRIWSLLANDNISVRTVGRVMALNKQVYDDSPRTRKKEAKQPPPPHPYKATRPHQYWCIDGRMMDFE